MSDGLTLSGNYTWSKMIEENGGGNQIGGNNTTNPTITEVDRIVQRSAYESDRRHRVTISGVYHLPFGRDQKFMTNASPIVDGILGGWEVAGMWLFNSGRPWGLPQNVFYVKDATIENVDFSAGHHPRRQHVRGHDEQLGPGDAAGLLGRGGLHGSRSSSSSRTTRAPARSSATIRSGGRRSISST